MSPLRIYADFNGLVAGVVNPSRTAVVLDTFGSLRDLSNAGVVLRRGLPLIAFDESDESEDLEGHGSAQYDYKCKRWVVEFDEMGVRYVPASQRNLDSDFHCVQCHSVLGDAAYNTVWRENFVCMACGTRAVAAFAPPLAT